MEEKRQRLEAMRREKRLARRRRALFYIACALIGIVLLVVSAYWSYTSRLLGGSVRGSSGIVSVLVMGSDGGFDGGTRTDTMMLFSVDKQTGSIGALSIPRDTRVQIPGRRGYDRINAAHAYGGPQLAVRTVEQLLGIKIDYFVGIDFEGFERIVDALGGVVMEIDRPMKYVDSAQDLYIDLRPGVQRLDGRQALHYVRYRGDRLGDVTLVDPSEGEYVGRVDRQIKFVRALMKQALNAQTIARAPQLIAELRSSVVTNIPTDEAVRLALVAKDFRADEVQTAILPGVGQTIGGASYWIVDPPKAKEVVNRGVAQRREMVRVEVLNGNGQDGMASHVADLLRERGFAVVGVGNADHFSYTRTSIVPRRGNAQAAADVARALGWDVVPSDAVGPALLEQGVASDADVTVIVGSDFQI